MGGRRSGFRIRFTVGAAARCRSWAGPALAVVVGVGGLSLGVLAAPASATTTVGLALPQGYAFSILGHSCGGIQEKPYATGFASGTGYPTGEVYVSTRCGGSGRGGGGVSTLYSAWADVTWDFTGGVVSYARASTTPTVNPTLVVYDAHGNELYNQAGGGVVNGTQVYAQAYLVLAPGFVPVARVTGISTRSGPTSGGTSVTITGTGFTGATAVSFGSTAAQSFTVTSGTSITAVSPPVAAAGTVDVTVTDAGGTSATSAADQFTFIAPPTITGVSPNSGALAGGNWVTLTGANLSTTNKVSIGDTTTAFNVLSDTSLSVYIPAGESAETVTITVTTIGGTSARTSADQYTYLAPPPPPTVTGISPNTGSALGGTTVTITGTGFTNVVYVSFGGYGAQSFTINSDTSITALTPALYDGIVDVTVQTLASGWSATSPADQFTYADTAPTVTSVSPNTGTAAGADTVTITGTGFTTATDVAFGAASASFTITSDTSITATTPATNADGTLDVTVTNPGGTSATSPADQFTYTDTPPTVTSVSPNTGTAAGGDTVTITGTGFTTASAVSFAGVPAASFSVNNDGSITAVTPAGTVGTVDVTVSAAGGTSATGPPDQFTYM
jgi:hypothetical protein